MKNFSPNYFLILLLIFSLFFTACKKEDDAPCCDASNPACPNYDPCFGKTDAVSADFDTETRDIFHLPSVRIIKSDTFFAPARIYFVAKDSTADSYQWKVGSDARDFIEKEFYLDFDCPDILYQNLNIQLISERLIDTNCTTIEKLQDTVTKSIYFVTEKESPIFGEFRGYLTNDPTRLFNIKIIHKSRVSNPNPDPCYGNLWHRYIYNLVNAGCLKRLQSSDGGVFKEFNFSQTAIIDTNTCQYPFGYYATNFTDINMKYNSELNEIRIKFIFNSYPSSSSGLPRLEQAMEFIGTKL